MTYATPQGPFAQDLPTASTTAGILARQILRLIGPAMQAPDGSLNAADALALGSLFADARQTQLDSASQAFVDAATYMLTELELLYGIGVDDTLTDAARQARLTAFVRTVIGAAPQSIESAVVAYAGSCTVVENSAGVSVTDPSDLGPRGVFFFSVIVPVAIVLNPTKQAQVRAIVDRMKPAHTNYAITNAVGLVAETADNFAEVTAIGA